MRRTVLIALAALAVAIGNGLADPGTASACSCAAVSDPTHLAQADAVFAGTVVARVEHQPDPGLIFSGAPVVWTFSVDAVVKGAVALDQRVVAALDGSSCGFSFAIGQRYLVFADPATGEFLAVDPGAGLVTSLCSGTRALAAGAPIPDLRLRTPFRRHRVYWAGDPFEGLILASVSAPRGRVSFTYRGCSAKGCGVVLRIRTVRACRNPGASLVPITDPITIRGVPAGRRGGALVLFTGRLQVRILGDADLATRAARALLAANRAVPPADARAALPGPVRWAVREGLACPVR